MFTRVTGCARAVGAGMLLLAAFHSTGCDGSMGPGGPLDPDDGVFTYEHDFGLGIGTWVGDTADYGTETAPRDATVEIRALPLPFEGTGLYLGGTNRSDDLFIYAKSPVDGLATRGTYRVDVAIEFLTNAPRHCAGVGGAPGESVWIVAGATAIEPVTTFDGSDYRVNIDRGNQSASGKDAVVLGDIASPTDDDCSVSAYETKHVVTPHPSPLEVTADTAGRAWLLVGMDSGYEARSAVFLRKVAVTFTPIR